MILENSNRSVLHLDLDTFFVSVERLRNAELEDKPIMIGGKDGRGVVAACSYEARKFGVHSAMPMRRAKELCPDAFIISGDMEAYSQYSHMVTEVIAEDAPLFEKSSIDEFYLDLTGLDRFFGCLKWSEELAARITKETGLPISFGLSINKLVSKVATGEGKPEGRMEVPGGTERDFLAPMPVRKIPMAGAKTCELLRSMGIYLVSTLRAMPMDMIERLMGKNGRMLWKRAHGIDHSPVVPYFDAKSMSTERTFNSDTANDDWLKSLVIAMVEKLAYKLRKDGVLTACVTVKIRYSDFNTVSKQIAIPYTSCDHTLIKTAKELFEQLYTRRVRLRLVGVRFSKLVRGNYQIKLFDDTQERIALYQAMDKVKNRFGPGAVMLARSLDVMPKRPEVNAFAKEIPKELLGLSG